MKAWRTLALVALLLPCLAVSALASELEQAQAEAAGVDEVIRAAGEYGVDFDAENGVDLDSGLASLWDRVTDSLSKVWKGAAASCVRLLAVVLLCGLLQEAFSAAGGDTAGISRLVGVLGITAVALLDTGKLIGMGRETIGEMEAFSHALLPTVTALCAAAGAPARAAAGQLAAMLFSDMLLALIDGLLLPLVYIYVALSAAAAATGNEGLDRIGELCKWLATVLLSAVLLGYIGYLTISGAIAGGSDALALKTAKLALSGAVPVVGGILSGAAETVLAGAGILKGTVGVFGMLAVLGMCVVPFLQLGVHYLAYKLTGALSAAVGDKWVTGLIDRLGAAFGLVLGVTGACAFLLLVSMVSAATLAVR